MTARYTPSIRQATRCGWGTRWAGFPPVACKWLILWCARTESNCRPSPPLIPGHEFSGAVAGIGRGVSTVKEGDLVSAEMHVACGKCLQCRTGQAHICQHVRILGVDADGAFAGYAIIPETNIWKLSPSIPHDYASLLDPLGNAVHTVLAGPIAATTVAVTGCGALGLFSIAVANACGAAKVFAIKINEHRRKVAAEMGAGQT